MLHHPKVFAFIVYYISISVFGLSLKGQTAGPTAPEYSSFEPVDVTDMVSLVSGDFTYVLPLLEVPGPEGGYPVALSYHAGIKPHEQASWVGLGWTLNTGAIFRTVDGFPDDFNGKTRYVWDYWDGGETHVTSVGVGYCGFHVGLDFATDTYQGFGVGGSVGVGFSAGNSVGINATIGASPYGDPYASLGLSVSTSVGSVGSSSFSAGASIGISTNFENVSYNAGGGISYAHSPDAAGKGLAYGHSILGAGISSSSLKPGMSVAGSSISQTNSNAGKISSFTNAWGVSIPVIFVAGLTIDVGHSYTRYWSSEWDYLNVYGSLFPTAINSEAWGDGDNVSFDSYIIPDMEGDMASYPDNEASSWGSFPSYDNYTVTGQGIGGSIQPYILETAGLKRQDRVDSDGNHYIEYLSTSNSFNKEVYFRFKNDFSNSLLKTNSTVDPESIGQTLANISNGSIERNVPAEYAGVNAFNASTNELAGSRNVTWFTNQQIYDQEAYNRGFISDDEPGMSSRLTFAYDDYTPIDVGGNDDISGQIGGFMITNESGVTYHYSIPVYTYQELSYTWLDAETKRISKNYHPYAYTWLLTAITGPDYVDDWDGSNGKFGPSKHDNGYWVKFDYGMWSPNYQWRSPSDKPFEVDIDGDVKSFSRGRKQIYYLNAIRTRSHTALFVKKHRADGKGLAFMSTSGEGEGNPNEADAEYSYEKTEAGEYPTALLALDEIILFKNNILDNRIAYWETIKTIGSAYNFSVNDKGFHLGENVIDVADIGTGLITTTNPDTHEEETFDIYQNALRVIKFSHSQTLCNGVNNSFDENGSMYGGETDHAKQGKLTLESVSFYGKGKEESLPPIIFSYNTPNPVWQVDGDDIWGYHKSDYNSEIKNDNVRKMVTNTSKEDVDAWCLSDIKTSLGATIHIDYESDSYLPPKLYGLRQVPVYGTEYDKDAIETTLRTDYFPIDLSDKLVERAFYNCIYRSSGLRSRQCVIESVSKVEGKDEWEIIVDAFLGSDMQGELSFRYPDNSTIFGGGIRVSSLSLITDRYTKYTHYAYEKNGVTSGQTSYEPYTIDDQTDYSSFNEEYRKKLKNEFKYLAYSDFYNLLKVVRFIPPPGVMYEQVTLTESIDHFGGSGEFVPIPGKKVYTFEVFDMDKHLNIDAHIDELGEENGYKNKIKTFSVKDFTNQVGRIISIEEYGANDVLLKSIQNYYANNIDETDERTTDAIILNDYSGQGVVQQEFQQYKKGSFQYLDCPDGCPENYIRKEYTCYINRYEEYPSIQVEKVEWNNKTKTESYTRNLAFDFYTGKPTKVLTTDPYGTRLLSESKPAYLYYPEMGPIMESGGEEITRKNMLTQTAFIASYALDNTTENPLDESARDGVLKADITLWNSHTSINNGNSKIVWQKEKDYVLVGDESTPLNIDGAIDYDAFVADGFTNYLFNPFNYAPYTGTSVPSPDNYWQKKLELTRYNQFSKVEEMQDINGNYGCAKYNSDMTEIIASAENAKYNEAAFSSFEYQDADPGLLFGLGDYNNASYEFAHTGLYSYIISNDDVPVFRLGAENVEANKIYMASVWMYIANEYDIETEEQIKVYASIGGSKEYMALPNARKKAGPWYLIDLMVQAPTETEIVIGVENFAGAANRVLIDDFRFAPLNASMTSYVYDYATGQLSHILDANNLFTEFEYDGFGNLKRVNKELIGASDKIRTGEKYIHYSRTSSPE